MALFLMAPMIAFLTQINFAQPRLMYPTYRVTALCEEEGCSPFLKNLGRLVRPYFLRIVRLSVIMIPLKLMFCVIAALFAGVTVISAQRRDATATINCAVITGLSLIAMEWA